jgi:peptidyl-prolyl cis-trans isomerase SurA
MASGGGLRAFALALLLAGPAAAQDLSPVIVVNDRAVTGYELDQRIRLLDAFNTPGDLAELARTQLVEERLKQQELDRVGVALSEEGLAQAITDFAARADLTAEEFTAQLGAQGIAPETLRDYVAANIAWRDYIRLRFGDRVEIGDEDVERALAQDGTAAVGLEVLLSEIIIPAPPGRESEVEALAVQLSQIRSTAEFEAAARQFSATRTRDQGGQLDWAPLSNYPEALQEILLDLAPGEVTPPLPLEGAVALLQLRDLREGTAPPVAPELIDYAQVRIPGGQSAEALAQANAIAAEAETCTDLFGLGLPDGNIVRQEAAPGALPQDVALDLAGLDPNEITWGRTENGGQILVLTMLCSRRYALPEGAPDREAVVGALRSEQLEAYSDAIVADLRASATIVGE